MDIKIYALAKSPELHSDTCTGILDYVDEEITDVEIVCDDYYGVNIRGVIGTSAKRRYFCELEKSEAIKMAKMILSFYEIVNTDSPR